MRALKADCGMTSRRYFHCNIKEAAFHRANICHERGADTLERGINTSPACGDGHLAYINRNEISYAPAKCAARNVDQK